MSDATMRLARVDVDGRARWAIVEKDRLVALEGSPFDTDWKRGGSLGAIEEARLLAPSAPSKIVCVGRNYVAHAAEHGADVPAEPLLFLKPPSSVVGHGAEIVLPSLSERVEHEAELALVIGGRCREISEQDAWRYVLGVTCANDVTARDLQRRDSQWTRGKGFDTFCPLGPWLVAGLEEESVRDLSVTCRVAATERQYGRTSQMVFPPAFLIAYISAVMTLEPGDVILTGTPSGVGPLTPGDVVEVEIEGVGILANPVVATR